MNRVLINPSGYEKQDIAYVDSICHAVKHTASRVQLNTCSYVSIMIRRLKGHANCRGRPPAKGACREGPARDPCFKEPVTLFEASGLLWVHASTDALAIKRRWGEYPAENRPNGSVVLTYSGSRTYRPVNKACGEWTDADTGFLCPERWFPPWKPRQAKARDWIGFTCTGAYLRTPGGRNHTSSSPQHVTAVKKRPGWIMPFFEQNKNQKSREITPALCFDITYQSQSLFRQQKQRLNF